MGCDNKTDLPQRLTLAFCWNNALILHGLFSLFSVDTLVMVGGLLPTSHHETRIEALFLPAPITLQNLVVQGLTKYLYAFLGRVMAPGRLQGLATSPRRDDVPSLHQFLQSPAGAAQNLVSINITPRMEFLYDASPDAPGAPLVRKTFGAAIAQCTRVQYLQLGLAHCPPWESEPHNTLCPLLANLPASLRAFSFHVWIMIPPQVRQSWNAVARSLAAVDRSLDPGPAGEGFRHLRRVELHVHFCEWKVDVFGRSGRSGDSDAAEKRARGQDIERVAAAMPLPRLKAAGLLREFRVDSVERGPGNIAPTCSAPRSHIAPPSSASGLGSSIRTTTLQIPSSGLIPSPILANLPATLRTFKFALHIRLDTADLWCCTSTSIGLETVDRILAPPSPSMDGREVWAYIMLYNFALASRCEQ
ncbi:hypothetical protein GSI_11455 [Ganoderma sinense ZZ0214-1]|uniref:Uncharacterized protein n=1 Tax=Ganoderma sinense ZZ0214-1 TaxID=1077348 RepID=A0A2G8RW15_9APHY|nr:hypothetical protein GSI_11455 [Ganoderma sinense ZZ0214-1]